MYSVFDIQKPFNNDIPDEGVVVVVGGGVVGVNVIFVGKVVVRIVGVVVDVGAIIEVVVVVVVVADVPKIVENFIFYGISSMS